MRSPFLSANNNPNCAFPIVSEWYAPAIDNNNSNCVACVTPYAIGGTVRFYLVSVFGNAFTGVSRIPINIRRDGGNVVLSWSNPAFALQAAPAVTDTYTNVPGATSPYTNAVTGLRQFFPLKY